ncbi:MarR family winged helix-turn-helix transcriptional regulator [Microbacterium sp. CIAB417]|uniref:MarR family winged helix-turn-helix transcriptional regulator n=1 Tax=Microbacterium sp. CIAB417 TaxID=2860287 RepID=UPI001FABFD9F|nr:MarR family transcriptional regulator [Microbacterium sp. CIAB417]
MNRADIVPSIVLSAHALARIAAQDARNEAPSAQWRVLSILERDGGVRVGALATAARTTQPGMTRLIGDLERTGLVRRSADPADSRATVVTITAEGVDALHAWRAEFRATLEPRFAALDEDDWAALSRAAEILAIHSAERPLTETGDRE